MANNLGLSVATGSNFEVVSVVARSIDLCAVLINNSNYSNPIMHAVIEMSQWLGREELNRHELQDCLGKARGAAFPSMTAELLLDDVRKGTHTMVAGPFFPRASGSLGRLMANDPNLSWMVTTITCLFQFHSASEVNRCVRDLIVAAVRKESDAEVGCHDPSRVHLGRVVDKIVSSIWFNVVNAGRMTIQLPEELTSICGNGHHLESLDFATVVVGGKIIYKKELGERRQAIEFRVDRSCAGTGCCGVRERSTFEVFADISDNPKCFFSGLYNPPKARGNIETAMVRRKLYQLPDAHLVESRARQHGIQILIKCTAQKMMRWILSLGVSSPYDFTNLGFRVQLEGEPEARYRKTRDLFHRSPSILNQRWGDSRLSNVVFCMPVSNEEGRPMSGTSDSGTSESGSKASTVYQTMP